MLKRLFGRKAKGDSREGTAPRTDEALDPRPGVEPPPPSTSRPGVTVRAATAGASFESGDLRRAASFLGPLGQPAPDPRLSWAAIALSGAAAGDVVVARGADLDLAEGTHVLLDGVGAGEGGVRVRVGRDDLAGVGLPGITGARVLARGPARAVLRLGPPPAARWAVVGLRSVAVFTGKLTLVDGDEGLDVRAGQVAFVADPTATLHVVAGNDAAVAVAFASADVVVRLG